MRFKIGLFTMTFFLILGFVVFRIPHTNPFFHFSYMPSLSPSAQNFLGTTPLGQDIFWMLVNAIHNSLTLGLIAATIGTVIGIFLGLLAGFSGGIVDRIISTVTDTFIVIPTLPILILITALIGGGASVPLLALVLAMFGWAWPSRQIRSMALSLKERDFISTAKFSGESTPQIIVTEILPYTMTWSLVSFMNATLASVAAESGLAILGLSPANLVTLGNMIQWARERNAILAGHWFWIGAPIIAMVVLFIGLFLLISGYNGYLSRRRGQ
jgi:peptide/nickel transport system permease protein